MKKFELKLRQRDIPEQDLLADIRRVADTTGLKTITKLVYDEHGQYGATTIIRRLGSWNKALEAAGLELNNRINIPEEELFKNLANIWQHLGRQPVGKDISKSNKSEFSLGTYEKRFGSWNNGLLAFIEYIKSPNPDHIESTSLSNKNKSITSSRTPRKINWRLRAKVLIRDNCICKMCGASPAKDSSVTLHIDHVLPWSKGGETIIENLQTLCSVCNIGKSDEIFN